MIYGTARLDVMFGYYPLFVLCTFEVTKRDQEKITCKRAFRHELSAESAVLGSTTWSTRQGTFHRLRCRYPAVVVQAPGARHVAGQQVGECTDAASQRELYPLQKQNSTA
jgi:hypothetical protein